MKYALLISLCILSIICSYNLGVAQEADDPAWAAAGFSSNEAFWWVNGGFSLQEAQQWVAADIDPHNAPSWRSKGFSIDQAKQWKRSGLGEGSTAKDLLNMGVEANDYAKWKALGITGSFVLKDVLGAGFTIEIAQSWHDLGIANSQWLEYKKRGVTLQEAREWSEIGVTSIYTITELGHSDIDLSSATRWYAAIPDHAAWTRWLDAGCALEDASAWIEVGVTTSHAFTNLRDSDIDLETAQAWHQTRLSIGEWAQWRGIGITPEDATKWVALGIDRFHTVNKLTHSDIDLNSATRWHAVTADHDAWTRWVDAGCALEEVQAWAEVGVTTPHECSRMRDSGIDLNTAQAWHQTGLRTGEWAQWRGIGITPEDAAKWAALGIDIFYTVNEYRESGIDVKEATAWRDISVTGILAISEWQLKGYDAASAKAELEARQQSMESKSIRLKIIVIAAAVLVVWGLILGLADKAVIYLNAGDLTFSFSPFIALILGWFIGTITWEWVQDASVWLAGALLLGVIFSAFAHNGYNVFKAIPAAATKIALSFVVAIKVLDLLSPGGKNNSDKRMNRTGAFIVLALLMPLIHRLVNGDRVAAKVGQ